MTPEHIERIGTYQKRPKNVERYARRVAMKAALREATNRHNVFLRELGLPLAPAARTKAES